MGSETRTCVAALGLGEEGVNGTHGGSKDVGRREAKGRASQRKHLRERRDSPSWWLFWDLGHNHVYIEGEGIRCAGEDRAVETVIFWWPPSPISQSLPWIAGIPGSLSPTCPGMEEPRGKASPEWWR